MSEAPGYQRLFAELKRRKVFRVAAVYGAVAFVVLQVADILVPALHLPESFTTGIALLSILGFPIALVLAWAFDSTPSGLQRTDAATTGELEAILAQPAASRWPSGLLALAGVVALVVGGWLALSSRPTTAVSSAGEDSAAPAAEAGVETAESATDGPPSIAVLPFDNMSRDPETLPFTDGLHDDLLTQLSKIGSLKVISRTSVQEYRDSPKSIPAIGDELGVSYVLEGGVQRAGDQFRLNVQLIDAESEGHLWAEQYTGDLTVAGIFAIQTEIATQIAEALQAQLTTGQRESLARVPTEDLEAYESYRRALENIREGYSEVIFRTADRLADQALALDSTFAEAWAIKSAAGPVRFAHQCCTLSCGTGASAGAGTAGGPLGAGFLLLPGAPRLRPGPRGARTRHRRSAGRGRAAHDSGERAAAPGKSRTGARAIHICGGAGSAAGIGPVQRG